MSDINLHALDALVRGAVLGLLVLPATLLAWRLTLGLAGWRRALVASAASLGLTAPPGLLVALVAERPGHEGNAFTGTMLAALALQLLLFPILLYLTRKA